MSRSTPGGIGQVQHRIARGAELDALMLASAGSRCPRGGRKAAGSLGLPLPCEIMTTNAGRSWFSLPSP